MPTQHHLNSELERQLGSFMQCMCDRSDAAAIEVIRDRQQRLARSGIVEAAVKLGDTAPDFTLPDSKGKIFALHDALANGPTVLVFFRGGWCPFCTLTLRAMDRIVPQLGRFGAGILAIAPQNQTNLATTAERNNLHFPLLSDVGCEVIRRYGLSWKMDDELMAIYQRFGRSLPQGYGSPDTEVPIAATYVVGRDGVVAAAHVSVAITSRMCPQTALQAVAALVEEERRAVA